MESTIDRYRLAVEVEFHQDGTKEVEKELAEHGTLQDTFQYSASELGSILLTFSTRGARRQSFDRV